MPINLPPAGPHTPAPAATPVNRSEPLSTWRVGQVLAATVVPSAKPETGVADLRIGTLLVKAQTGALNLAPGQQLRLEVASLKQLPVLKLLGTVQQSPLQPLLRDALPRQQPLPLLFTALAQLTAPAAAQRSSALSPEIYRLASEMLDKLPDTARVSTADGLRQAIRDSGLFLESKLAQAAAQNPTASSTVAATAKPDFSQDFKANLLRLVQVVRDNAATSAPGSARSNPLLNTGVPSTGSAAAATPAPSSPSSAAAALAAALRQAPGGLIDPAAPLQRGQPPVPPLPLAQLAKGLDMALPPADLQRAVEGALARVQVHQLSSLPPDRALLPEWLIELPIRRDSDTDVWSLRLSRDSERERDHPDDGGPAWSVMLAFDLPGIGPMQSRVSLRGERVTAQFFSQMQGVLPLVMEHLPLLQARLTQAGLNVEELSCHHGEIPKPKAAPQARILDERA